MVQIRFINVAERTLKKSVDNIYSLVKKQEKYFINSIGLYHIVFFNESIHRLHIIQTASIIETQTYKYGSFCVQEFSRFNIVFIDMYEIRKKKYRVFVLVDYSQTVVCVACANNVINPIHCSLRQHIIIRQVLI